MYLRMAWSTRCDDSFQRFREVFPGLPNMIGCSLKLLAGATPILMMLPNRFLSGEIHTGLVSLAGELPIETSSL